MIDDGHRPGTVTEDPLGSLPIGSTVRFSHELFRCEVPAGINAAKDWDFFKGALISLHFGSVARQRIMGSGVLVAPGVAVAARHVAEAEMQAVLEGRGFICSAIAATNLMFWRPRHVVYVPDSDLALLTLQYASVLPEIFRQATITTRLPRIGETIVIAGTRHEQANGGTDARDMRVSVMAAADIRTGGIG